MGRMTCPGCQERDARDSDEDTLCEECRDDIDATERMRAYADALGWLELEGFDTAWWVTFAPGECGSA